MPSRHRFEHLALVLRQSGDARFNRPPRASEQVRRNRDDRLGHRARLQEGAKFAIRTWTERQVERRSLGLPVFDGTPLVLEIDRSLRVGDLQSAFSLEVVSEGEDGLVLTGASDSGLEAFQARLDGFARKERGSGHVAQVLGVRGDPARDRLSMILTEVLLKEWETMEEDAVYLCDYTFSCEGTWEIPKKPTRNRRWKETTWLRKLREWERQFEAANRKWDELKDLRVEQIEVLVAHYGGTITDSFDEDQGEGEGLLRNFTLRVRMSARGLKDLVLNHPHLAEVAEPDDLETPQAIERQTRRLRTGFHLHPPDPTAPRVCVVDSGIQEGHLLLEAAIDQESSRCFLRDRSASDVADYVEPSGHGTRVAGAVLHGEQVPQVGVATSLAWIQNARVLDEKCDMPKEMLPAAALREVVAHFHGGSRRTRVFNHSINARVPCRTTHMSTWAAEMDRLCFENDILVVQSVGNLKFTSPDPSPGVAELLARGKTYPGFLEDPCCHLANPAQSLQALTVGSVGYGRYESQNLKSFVQHPGGVSAFSRSGPGLWQTVKPDVVEYGGDFLWTEAGQVSCPSSASECYPELVRATTTGGPAFDRDGVGTSFAAPKVTRIAAMLEAALPEESCLLYRALIAQSARWPDWTDGLSDGEKSRLFYLLGYGIPSADRACRNSESRITFITAGHRTLCAGDAHVYQVPIPREIRRPGWEHDIRVEVTLSYAARPRRTRRELRGYLSVWLDWLENRSGESADAFLARALKGGDQTDSAARSGLRWTVGGRKNSGLLSGPRRTGTLQKDWAVVRSYQLPEDFCIAVRGHQGWSIDPEATARYALAVSFESLGGEISIYEPLRTAALELEAELHPLEVEVEV